MILLLNVFLYEEVPVIANFNSPPLIRTLTVLDNQRNYFSNLNTRKKVLFNMVQNNKL